MNHKAQDLIGELIAKWSYWDTKEEYYLTVLAPSIVRSDGRSDGQKELRGSEKEIVTALRRLLSQEEWQRLPTLIAQHRSGKLKELDSDRERAKALEEAERERRRAEEARMAHKRALVARLEDALELDFLSADRVLAADPDSELLSAGEYGQLKTSFVFDWANRNLPQPLDREQAAAVAATSGDIQVVARAGSGKTRTLVARATFLQKHCRVSPHEILLLAFNKEAAEEMKRRLAETLDGNLPQVMTFHALAYALVQPEEDLIFDDASADWFGLSREVQEVIDEHVGSEEYGDCIRDLMLAYFREDWERIVDGRFEMNMEKSLALRRALPRESLKGDRVKSYGEKVISNALFEHGVEYRYERNFRWNGVNYRPDFTIPVQQKGGVIVEYFGLEGSADYDQRSEEKRQFWAGKDEWTFVELSPKDLRKHGRDEFVRLLLREIEKAGVPYRRRTEEEIWQLVKRRAVDRFTGVMENLVSRCRKLNLSPGDLESMVAGHTPSSTAEALFLGVGVAVYRGYLRRLVANDKIDFDGLVWRTVSSLREGQTRFVQDRVRDRGDVSQLRFVMIDEFQDFSQMFFELVNGIRSANPRAQFFCVGDDWQAINGFAGSDLRYFGDFAQHFRNISRHHIRTNYRSPRSVVEVGNALMHGRGLAAQAKHDDGGSVLLCKLDDFKPSVTERKRHNGDEITPALLRLVRCFLDRGMKDVVMLSRRNGVPWYVSYGERAISVPDQLGRFREHVCSYLPEKDHKRVKISTAHGFKGLEGSAVVVLDAIQRSYPLIHPNWLFLRVFGDSIDRIEDEERRLFYVAVTRAENSLALLTETSSQSPYIDDILQHVELTDLSWADLPPVPSLDSRRLEIRVSGAYDVKDQLKKLNYQWDREGRYWGKSVRAEAFSFDALLEQPWAEEGVRVKVYSESGRLLRWR